MNSLFVSMASKNGWLALLLCFSFSMSCYAQGFAADSTVADSGFKWSLLPTPNEHRLGLPHSINPDFHTFKMTKSGGKWRNMVGHNFGLVALEWPGLAVTAGPAGYVELHDFDQHQFMSWQLWRGNVGFNTYWDFKKLNQSLGKGNRILLSLGWFHESQHATDVPNYVERLTNLTVFTFENGAMRSFEFYEGQLYFVQQSGPVQLLLNVGGRYYPKPLLSTSRWHLENSVFGEIGISGKVHQFISLYGNGYFEQVNNNFYSNEHGYILKWSAEPFLYRKLEAGIELHNDQRQRFHFFGTYNHSNGRGLDFVRVYKEYGAGIRLIF